MELLDELLLELLDELLLELMLELLDELLDELPAEAVPAPTVIAMPIAPAPATTRVHVLVLGIAMVYLMSSETRSWSTRLHHTPSRR